MNLLIAMWGAKEFRPDGILNGADLWDVVNAKTTPSRFHTLMTD